MKLRKAYHHSTRKIKHHFTQKAVSFLYRNNEHAEIEIESTISFSVTSKKLKYSGICLTKQVHDLHANNYKMMIKIKDLSKDSVREL